jgi:hypothetical protein
MLVVNYGVIMALQHEYEEATSVFEYGLTQDACYPRLSYNLACVAAEQDDEERMYSLLETALEAATAEAAAAAEAEAAAVGGEGAEGGERAPQTKPLPNPLDDPTFQRYHHHEHFQRIATRFAAALDAEVV